jgi:hypothetical protein
MNPSTETIGWHHTTTQVLGNQVQR